MAEQPLHTRKQGNSLAFWAVAIIIAGLVFFGIWQFLNSHQRVENHPPGVITHSTPVGGKVQDGVFHPATVEPDGTPNRWQI